MKPLVLDWKNKLKKTVLNQLIAGFFCFGAVFGAQAQKLPEPVQIAFEKVGVSENDVGIWIAKAGQTQPVFALNADRPMQPASSVKIVTTSAALELLGPDYRWETHWLSSDFSAKSGVVRGLVYVGGGDPHYVIERLWLAAQRLRGLGVRSIEGDIRVDRRLFDENEQEQQPMDGQTIRAYNVRADAALISQRSVCLEIVPDAKSGVAFVTPIPRMTGFKVTSKVRLEQGPCSNWKKQLKAKFSPDAAVFAGSFNASCGKKIWPVSLWSPNAYLKGVFSDVLAQAGIRWKGNVKNSVSGTHGRELLLETSDPLSSLVVLTNKFSNNPMARHLFLSLSFADEKGKEEPASLSRSRSVLSQWLQKKGVNPKETFIENGSGLSRKTRISAQGLGRVIAGTLSGPYAAEFVSSLPISGEDGTMKRRPIEGLAHVKTGRLDGVRSAAGLVRDIRGTDWTVVVFVNSQTAGESTQAIDQILSWVGSGRLR